MKKITVSIIILLVMSFFVALWAYSQIDTDIVASHWNAEGEPNGYMSKFWGIFLMPIVSIAIYLLLSFVPRIDPLKANIAKFREHYDEFILIIICFMFYVFILTIITNLGYKFNMTTAILPAIGMLFVYIGTLLKKLKRNWFIGIRNPWTLSSNNVWEKTHSLGSKLFIIVGIIVVVGIFAPAEYLVWFILAPVLTVVIWLFIYSYLEFRKEKKRTA